MGGLYDVATVTHIVPLMTASAHIFWVIICSHDSIQPAPHWFCCCALNKLCGCTCSTPQLGIFLFLFCCVFFFLQWEAYCVMHLFTLDNELTVCTLACMLCHVVCKPCSCLHACLDMCCLARSLLCPCSAPVMIIQLTITSLPALLWI